MELSQDQVLAELSDAPAEDVADALGLPVADVQAHREGLPLAAGAPSGLRGYPSGLEGYQAVSDALNGPTESVAIKTGVWEDMGMNLSEAAKTALINVGTNRQGTVVQAEHGVLHELYLAGAIAFGGGLTRAGSIERQRVLNDRLDTAFGA